MMYVHQSKLGKNGFKRGSMESFCENISELIIGANRQQVEEFLLEFFADDMAIKINMFCVLMESRIVSYLSGRLAVAIEYSLVSVLNMEVVEKVAEPLYFTSGSGQGSVFDL